jgi:hypothetical protein
MTKTIAPAATFQTEILKGSPEYSVVDSSGAVLARAHCVHMPSNLYTLIVGGKWAGTGSEADVAARLRDMVA